MAMQLQSRRCALACILPLLLLVTRVLMISTGEAASSSIASVGGVGAGSSVGVGWSAASPDSVCGIIGGIAVAQAPPSCCPPPPTRTAAIRPARIIGLMDPAGNRVNAGAALGATVWRAKSYTVSASDATVTLPTSTVALRRPTRIHTSER